MEQDQTSTNWKVLLQSSLQWKVEWVEWEWEGRWGRDLISNGLYLQRKLFTPPTSQNPTIFPSSTAPKINRLGIILQIVDFDLQPQNVDEVHAMNPQKSVKKVISVGLGVSRTYYVNVDSPNLGSPYFNP